MLQVYHNEFSQSHRMAEGGRELFRSSGPTHSPLKQDHPEQVAQNHVQVVPGYLQGGDSAASLGSLFSSTCTVEEHSLMCR